MLKFIAKDTAECLFSTMGDTPTGYPVDMCTLGATIEGNHKTSPTNIGLFMHALLEAEAAEIVAPDVATEKLTKVIDRLSGHLANTGCSMHGTMSIRERLPATTTGVQGSCRLSITFGWRPD